MMELLQQAPAETTAYMLAGYGVIFGVMIAYVISLVVRTRNLKQDYQLLKELEAEQND
jgi:uncharacterized membrane-anchored protein YhcB (DUF1043 family)